MRNILSAIDSGNTEMAKSIIKEHPEALEARDKDEKTALHLVLAQCYKYSRETSLLSPVYRSRIEIAKFIINEYPETLKAIDKDGKTPLHLSVAHPCEGVVMRIIHKNPDLLYSVDNNGKTPLNLALESDNHLMEIVLKREQEKEESKRVVKRYYGPYLGSLLLFVSNKEVFPSYGLGIGVLVGCLCCEKDSARLLCTLSGGLIGLATSYIAKYYIDNEVRSQNILTT